MFGVKQLLAPACFIEWMQGHDVCQGALADAKCASGVGHAEGFDKPGGGGSGFHGASIGSCAL